MKIADAHRIRIRIRKCSGRPNAIVGSDGKDVHVEVGELRYGKRKAMLVELELDNNHDLARMAHDGLGDSSSSGRHGARSTPPTSLSRAWRSMHSLGDGPNLMGGMDGAHDRRGAPGASS